MSEFKDGDPVSFNPGRSTTPITAKVTGHKAAMGGRGGSAFLITTDEAGKERKLRSNA